MTVIVFKPEPNSSKEKGRGLYRAFLNHTPMELFARAKTAAEADAMLQYLFSEHTKGRILNFTIPKGDEYVKETDKGADESARA